MKEALAFRRSTRLAHTLAFFDSPDAAAPRNLTREMLQTLAGNQAVAGPQFALESQYQPLYNQLQLRLQQQQLEGYTDAEGVHHPGTIELSRTRAAGDIATIDELGPASTEAFLNANPFLRSSLTSLLGRTSDSNVLQELNDQANTALASGGALSPQEERDLTQRTRAGFAERGNVMGNQALGAELLNRDAAMRTRMAQAQQFASGVQNLNQGQNDFVGRASQIFGSQLSDPFQALLGRSSGAGGGAQQQIGTGARIFDPMNAYAQDLYNTNFNAEAANNIQQSNAQNANTQALIGAAASILGGFLSDERLKKKIKKVGETEDGIPIKEFEYLTDEEKRRFRGVMAQDVEKVKPEYVRTDPVSGVKVVDYWGLGMPMVQIPERKAA